MNDVFFEELGIPEPDVFMAAGAARTRNRRARSCLAFEQLCQAERPAAVLV